MRNFPMVTGIRPQPIMHGIAEPFVIGNQPAITCSARYFMSGNVSIFWSSATMQLPSHDVDIIIHDNNTATFTSALDYEFRREEDEMNVTCALVVNDVVNPNFTTSTTSKLNLHCKCILKNNLTIICGPLCMMIELMKESVCNAVAFNYHRYIRNPCCENIKERNCASGQNRIFILPNIGDGEAFPYKELHMGTKRSGNCDDKLREAIAH